METLVPTATELTITKPTEFEKLMTRVKKETLEVETSLSNQSYMRVIIKEIASVYFFLRKEGLGYSPITIKEFEITQEHLLGLARQKTSQPFVGLFRRSRRYFLRNKFFPCVCSPVGNWYEDHPWRISSYDDFDLSDTYTRVIKNQYFMSLPPNLRELAKEIFSKRHSEE